MKRAMWALVLVAIVSFVVWSSNPLDDTMNFIIGGSIPGTKASLGFWPMMGIIGLILFIIRRGIKNALASIIEETTKNNQSERAQAEFKDQNSGDIQFDRKNRSVIAAPNVESI